MCCTCHWLHLPCQLDSAISTTRSSLTVLPCSQHRVSPFSLRDRTKPGHRRFVALWLVDPYIRIISTANVPPQQRDWWQDAVFSPYPDLNAASTVTNTGKIPGDRVTLLSEGGIELPPALARGSKSYLPPELLEMVRKEEPVPTGLMGRDEAERLREELMEERTTIQTVAEDERWSVDYNFCEH
jgi:hypothetical protein